MNGRATVIRWSLLAGLACLLATASARAATNPSMCTNDIDCVATPKCGGEVCDYNRAPAFTCKAAGTDPMGSDGWCDPAHGNADCKCASLGAVCNGTYCTFTLPSQAPSGGAGSGGGSAGTTGSAGATGSAGTTGSAGATGSAGTKGSTGSAGTTGTSGGGGGGCSLAGSSPLGGSFAFAAAGMVGALIRRRPRGRV
jgi:hypothetical protein